MRAGNAGSDAAEASNIPALVKFAELKRSRLDGLAAHAVFPISTGKLEGFNNKIKVAKRIGYGYRDDEYFWLYNKSWGEGKKKGLFTESCGMNPWPHEAMMRDRSNVHLRRRTFHGEAVPSGEKLFAKHLTKSQ